MTVLVKTACHIPSNQRQFDCKTDIYFYVPLRKKTTLLIKIGHSYHLTFFVHSERTILNYLDMDLYITVRKGKYK